MNWLRKQWKNIKAEPLLGLAFILGFTGVAVIIGYLLILMHDYDLGYKSIDVTKTGAVGDFIGGLAGTIISAAGFIFLYINLKEQRENAAKEKVESRFFEMLKIHRENVSEANVKLRDSMLSGVEALAYISLEVIDLVSAINFKFSGSEITEYVQNIDEACALKGKNVGCYDAIALLDVIHDLTYFGWDSSHGAENEFFRNSIIDKYKPDFYNKLHAWLQLRNILIESRSIVLDRYFLNLFQVVNYIDKQSMLNNEQKYEYIELVKAQMTVHESMLLLINSVAYQSRYWEYSIINGRYLNLITKYDLVATIFNPLADLWSRSFQPATTETEQEELIIMFKDIYPYVKYRSGKKPDPAARAAYLAKTKAEDFLPN
jgi:hypothetical protein